MQLSHLPAVMRGSRWGIGGFERVHNARKTLQCQGKKQTYRFSPPGLVRKEPSVVHDGSVVILLMLARGFLVPGDGDGTWSNSTNIINPACDTGCCGGLWRDVEGCGAHKPINLRSEAGSFRVALSRQPRLE